VVRPADPKVTRLELFVSSGLHLRGGFRWRRHTSVTFSEILSAERLCSGRGFRLHSHERESLVVLTGKDKRRDAERRLRDGGVLIVDQYGARIDESQFEKEADPDFNRRPGESVWPLLLIVLTPNVVHRWRHRRLMRQWSDDAEGE
jgi:hypothetical protein